MKRPETNLITPYFIDYIDALSKDQLIEMRENIRAELRIIKETSPTIFYAAKNINEQKNRYFQELELVNYNLHSTNMDGKKKKTFELLGSYYLMIINT